MCRFVCVVRPPSFLVGLLLAMLSSNTLFVHCGGGDTLPNIEGQTRDVSAQPPPTERPKDQSDNCDHCRCGKNLPSNEDKVQEGPAQPPHNENPAEKPVAQRSSGGRNLFKGIGKGIGSAFSKVDDFVVSPARKKAEEGVKKFFAKASPSQRTAENAAAKNGANSKNNATSSGRNESESGAEHRNDQMEANSAEQQTEPNASTEEGPSVAESSNNEKRTNSDDNGTNANVTEETGGGKECPPQEKPSAAQNIVETVAIPLRNASKKVLDTACSGVQLAHENVLNPAVEKVKPVAKPPVKYVYNKGIVPGAHGLSTALGYASKKLGNVKEWKEDGTTEEKAEEQEKKKKGDE